MKKIKLTVAQALIRFLANQYVRRDGVETPYFAGVWGIFGHGNVAGIGQALQEYPQMPYYLCRNEQAMTHTAIAYAKAKYRMQAFACTSSIGPGATNMLTGAATATINRIPLLLLPGDIFARRNVAPVLQQLEYPLSQDVSVNDAFKPLSRYWDRINRPDQLPWAMLEAVRVLTSPADTGTVTLCMPQDVQTEAYEYSASLFEKRVWNIPRQLPDQDLYREAVQLLKNAEKPFIISGGGVLYSEAFDTLAEFAEKTGIPVGETQAGKGALSFNHESNLGAVGASGTSAANKTAEEADVVLLLGTRLTDFTTASKSQFQHPDVKFIHVNVNPMDANKLSAIPLQGDAKATLELLAKDLEDYAIPAEYGDQLTRRKEEWSKELDRVTSLPKEDLMQQPTVLGAVNEAAGKKSTVVCAAGSMPGDLHKLWKTYEPGGYHMEYGYSCMGYEIAGGLGVKMARPDREVVVMVGDGSYQMISSELITAVQENIKITVVLLDNSGFGSIGSLSESLGSEGFGTNYRYRNPETGELNGQKLPLDYVMNARSYGVDVQKAESSEELVQALDNALQSKGVQVIVVPVDKVQKVPGYSSWWDVPVAEKSSIESVNKARKEYEKARERQRDYF
ncbi:3D-(3,5/4)-trihydroxycyclohexane-1,2-dione acylhydrolase (decyclizing) [Aliifodinibius sp. S!AR15-10]|uniref:3D-(3,5/4)-trihydroxycyclohexane-1,2-dione acylhydrolase (decyclizing) n=1 Tax=Aliifodinibius sp. S!AR15-10 TaxID=2950437 RepID=UPI00285D2304|nr:3D-(3,5/4)-trihydroxycyclohexane-1,2-dione acylhydrolase (decyclizing) [Aliifodinibius sp. S!AR15-10]MDR8391720.1 3D-(3,5/4)-trihydroxycyclohexane-1,2-dione acylhydrolase (decyclizing) [Aliifodinibius sp. S!AR15-10]